MERKRDTARNYKKNNSFKDMLLCCDPKKQEKEKNEQKNSFFFPGSTDRAILFGSSGSDSKTSTAKSTPRSERTSPGFFL